MVLTKINLSFFRNFTQSSFEFNDHITLISGKNAVGKTNILEAIYTACHTKGFRETRENELIMFNQKRAFITSLWKHNKHTTQFSIIFESLNNNIHKYYRINKTTKSHLEYTHSIIPAIIFSPSYMFLIDGGHEQRRKYFDTLISSIQLDYRKHLINYDQGLRKRNKIIQRVHDKTKLRNELEFWNNYLIFEASFLTKERNTMCSFFNKHNKHGNNSFEIVYEPNLFTQKRLEETFEKEFRIKQTMVGPQRDTFTIMINNKDTHRFGSRSEQRFALLWLTITSLEAFKEKNIKPILLLDDVFSELDQINKKTIVQLISDYQTVLTTTETDIIKILPNSLNIITL